MASTSSSSSQTSGAVEVVSVDVGESMLDSSSFNTTDSKTHEPLRGSNPTATFSNASSDSYIMSTPVLVGIIAASVIVFVAILFAIRSRRRRYEPKLFSPSSNSTFQGVTSTIASENSNTLGDRAASTFVASPQPSLMQTFKLSRLSAKEVSGDHIGLDVHDAPGNGGRGTQASRTTSLISDRSVFSMSLLRGGLRSSLPSLSVFRMSRSSGVNRGNELQSMDSSGSLASTVPYSSNASTPPLPIEQRHIERDAWRDLSETCWSIGPDSDSETENERYTMSTAPNTQGGPLVLNRNRLSTLSDGIADIEEEGTDIHSIDESSHRNRGLTLDDLSPRRERGISQFDDSSPRRVRGLSALDSRQKAHSVDIDTNESSGSYFSVDSDYYDETIKDCSSILFDSDSESDSDDSLREEEF